MCRQISVFLEGVCSPLRSRLLALESRLETSLRSLPLADDLCSAWETGVAASALLLAQAGRPLQIWFRLEALRARSFRNL